MRRFARRMRVRSALLAALLASSSALVWAQAGRSVGAPILGYVPDGASLRSVVGIPAAATVAAKLAGADGFAQIAASPAADFALVSLQETGEVRVYREGVGLTPIAGAGSGPDLLLLSPKGQAGLLWFSSLSRAQVLTGFPDKATWRFFDATYLDRMPTALAVSDDGQWVAGAWSQGVYAFGPKGEVVRMQINEPGTAVAFAKGSHDFVVATALRLMWVADPGGRASVNTLLSAQDGLPLNMIAVAGSNQRALAISSTGKITIANLDSTAVTLDCGCQPEGLIPMSTGSYRVSRLQDGMFKLLDLDQQRVFVVPLRDDQRDANPTAAAAVGGAQ
ncbi:MAG: hypothetical protein ABI824_08760 [Acidobacteriota bacterium]